MVMLVGWNWLASVILTVTAWLAAAAAGAAVLADPAAPGAAVGVAAVPPPALLVEEEAVLEPLQATPHNSSMASPAKAGRKVRAIDGHGLLWSEAALSTACATGDPWSRGPSTNVHNYTGALARRRGSVSTGPDRALRLNGTRGRTDSAQAFESWIAKRVRREGRK